MGYAGGKTIDPDYGNIGDHTETIQIDFDPRQITYNDLLKIFWASHKPTRRTWSRQYRHAVFYHNEAQRQLALQSKLSTEEKTGRKVRTEVLPLNAFYRAEDYHQKYILNRRSEFAQELARIYPRKKDFVDSTAVARLNGYIGGHGNMAQLKLEIEELGLSADSRESLLELVRRKGGGLFN